ncbi:MAG: hypothetical protein V4671_14940 [Armatimonadota bacterium]
MDKTSRLIKWQRITVATLLLAVAALGYTSYQERQQANATRAALQRLVQSNLLVAAEREVADKEHEASDAAATAAANTAREAERDEYRQTIDGLEAELARYRNKYGEIGPKIEPVVGEGEIVYDVINTNCFPDHDDGGAKIVIPSMSINGEMEPFEPGAFKHRVDASMNPSAQWTSDHSPRMVLQPRQYNGRTMAAPPGREL